MEKAALVHRVYLDHLALDLALALALDPAASVRLNSLKRFYDQSVGTTRAHAFIV